MLTERQHFFGKAQVVEMYDLGLKLSGPVIEDFARIFAGNVICMVVREKQVCPVHGANTQFIKVGDVFNLAVDIRFRQLRVFLNQVQDSF